MKKHKRIWVVDGEVFYNLDLAEMRADYLQLKHRKTYEVTMYALVGKDLTK